MELLTLCELYFNTRHGTARMNTEETLRLSVTCQMWILAFRITDYSFWKY